MLRSDSSPVHSPTASRAAVPASPPTDQQPGSEIPPCALCGYDLRGTVEYGGNRCPECGWKFTPQDLALIGPSNLEGTPRSLKPGETRVRGGLMVTLLMLAALTVIGLILLAGYVFLK